MFCGLRETQQAASFMKPSSQALRYFVIKPNNSHGPSPPAPIRTSLSCVCSVRSIASEARRWSASTIYCSSSWDKWKWSQKHIINHDNDSYDMFQFSKDLNFQISNHDMFQFSKDFKRSINSEVEFFFFNIDNGQPLFLLLVLLFKTHLNMGFFNFCCSKRWPEPSATSRPSAWILQHKGDPLLIFAPRVPVLQSWAE